jgi:3-oxoacyl-[acyl-carrier-protein] synthase-1/3-oxoacyl-[acyl-carrier-protein] synthase II
MSVAIVAWGAVSGLGRGAEAASAGNVGEPARVAIAVDEELRAGGFAKPFAARVRLAEGKDDVDRATRILGASLADCVRDLDATLPGWRAKRVGLSIGTSSGGMRTAEQLFARIARGEPLPPELAARAAYFGPLLDVAREKGIDFAPATLVLCACSSSLIAIGLGARWLDLGKCDLVLAGGFDAVSPFVASGFESLQATSTQVPPRPFRVGRDGMALGEAGAVLALTRLADRGTVVRGYVCGFGASADAVHITAPDKSGAGLAQAARAALTDAGNPRVDLVSAHATATPFNDAAEARGTASALGAGAAGEAFVHAFKAQIGHTLGAAGAIESLVALDAIARGVFPATAGEGALDPDAPARILAVGQAGAPRVALKLASAFGGANAALVLRCEPPPLPAAPPAAERAQRPVFVSRAVRVSSLPDVSEIANRIGANADKLARADAHVLWALAALASLADRLGRDSFAGAGVVVGTAAATIETNGRYAARLRERGPRFVEARRFPYTSPNAVAGECGMAFGLRGPAFTVGAGLHAAVEALAAAVDLVAAGDAERMLVVAVDEIGDVAAAWAGAVGATLVPGAVALLVSADRMATSAARVVSTTTSLGPAREGAGVGGRDALAGHLALAPLDAETLPARLESVSALLGTVGRACVELAPIGPFDYARESERLSPGSHNR